MGGGHVWEAGRGLPLRRGGEGSQRACYPAHLKRALEPAVLGCVKRRNFPPLMYNLELTANKMGFCLYILVLFVCLTFACKGRWRLGILHHGPNLPNLHPDLVLTDHFPWALHECQSTPHPTLKSGGQVFIHTCGEKGAQVPGGTPSSPPVEASRVGQHQM